MLRNNVGFVGVLVLYLVVGWLYIRITPAWQAPDEPAHYNYVRQVADQGIPLMEAGDYDQALLSELTRTEFAPSAELDRIESIQYEDYQPPLYYAVAATFFQLGDGSLSWVRWSSLLLSVGVVGAGYWLGRVLAPHSKPLALSVAIFIAFLPQHLAIMTAVNNDALAELLIAMVLVILITRDWTARPAWQIRLAIILGFCFLTKVTAYLSAGVIFAGLLTFRDADTRPLAERPIKGVTQGFVIYFLATLIGLLWWIRNIIVYPGLDFLGINVHDRIVLGQLTTAEYIQQFGLSAWIERMITWTFNSFWGQFGWMAAPYQNRIYWVLYAFTALAFVGAILAYRRWEHEEKGYVTAVFGSLTGLVLLLYLVYNARYVQTQARYLFPALIPISFMFAGGSHYWWRLGTNRWLDDPRFEWLVPIGLLLGLLALNAIALIQIIPCLDFAAAC